MILRFKKTVLILLSLTLFSCKSTEKIPFKSMQKDVTEPSKLSSFEENTMDGILVSVSDRIILLSDLQQAILAASNGQTHLLSNGKLVGGTLTTKQADFILQSLINEKVLQEKSAELGLDLTDDELTQRINGFLKQQGYTQADLEAQLQKSNKSMEDYRKEFKNEMLKQQVIGKVVSPFVTVTNEEVKAFYLQQTKSTKQISTVKLRSLMINIPENEIPNFSHAPLVQTIQKKIAKGDNFTSLVKKYSMAVNASENEGVLPPRSIQQLPPDLAKQLNTLNINDVAGPFLIGSSVFFFQYLGAEFVNSSDMQINFNAWKNKLLEIKFNERLVEYLQTERSKLRINERPFVITRSN